MFYIGVFQAWHYKALGFQDGTDDVASKEQHLRCRCRALMLLLLRLRQSETPLHDRQLIQLKRDAIEASSAWLTCLSDAHDDNIMPASTLDPYDVANVGITCIAIYVDADLSGQVTSLEAEVPSLITQCIAIISSMVNTNAIAKKFRKTLLLCSRAIQSTSCNLQVFSSTEMEEIFPELPRQMFETLSSITQRGFGG
jgi:hypothetical protein